MQIKIKLPAMLYLGPRLSVIIAKKLTKNTIGDF